MSHGQRTDRTKMKTEMGRVHYLTYLLEFPNGDQWLKQEPIPGASTLAILHFVKGLQIRDEFKTKLCKDLEASWKQPDGVWIQLKIEATKRNPHWGPDAARRRFGNIQKGV